MFYQNIIAVNAEINSLLQTALGHDNIVQGVAFPVVFSQHPRIEQHPAVQRVLAPGNRRQLCFHFVHLTGGQKAAAAQVDAEDGLFVLQREVGFVQDGAIAANGQDDVCLLQALFSGR